MFNFFLFKYNYTYVQRSKTKYTNKSMNNTKKIVIIEEKTKKVKLEKPKRKRIVTQTLQWEKAVEELESIENIKRN